MLKEKIICTNLNSFNFLEGDSENLDVSEYFCFRTIRIT